MQRPSADTRGFTLVEMIVLIGIIGLIAAIAVPSFNGYLRANRLATTADQMAADMALARATAVAQGRIIRFDGDAAGYTITDPGDGRVIRDREFGGTVALAADASVNFFPWGAAEVAVLTLDDGNDTRQVQVLPTGMVEVGP